jgi:hypothetical protein
MLNTGFTGSVYQRLALCKHGYGISGQKENSIHTGQRSSESSRVVQIKVNDILPLGTQTMNLLKPAGSNPHVDLWVTF